MKTLPLTLLLFLSGCAIKNANSSFLWTPMSLNESKNEMDGQVVSARAFLIDEPENHALWDSAAFAKERKASHCISLLYTDDMKAEVRKYNRREVIIRGVFKKDFMKPDQIWLGMCNFTGLVVAEIQPA